MNEIRPYKTNTFSFDEGSVFIQFPFPLSQQSATELEEFIGVWLRMIKRCATGIPVGE